MYQCRLCGGVADEDGLHKCDRTGETVCVHSSPELFAEVDGSFYLRDLHCSSWPGGEEMGADKPEYVTT